jgi:uncharacterized circularly permuted ATP-grasp superfamily protein
MVDKHIRNIEVPTLNPWAISSTTTPRRGLVPRIIADEEWTSGEQPVHVVYRRVDDDFPDPLHFRPDTRMA